jgi:preprotein translocase subunit YajC
MNAQMTQLLFIALIIGVFYFLIIKPQQKRAKTQREMLSALRPGDEIVTIGGIFATVIEVGDRLRVRVASGAEMELAKQAVGQVLPAGSDDAAEPETTEEIDDSEKADGADA